MRISSSSNIYPEHCEVPTISEADKTLIAVSDLLAAIQAAVPHTAKEKLRHAKALQILTAIIKNTQSPRVTPTDTPPVSTSMDATYPKGDSRNTHRTPNTDAPQHAHANIR